MTNRYDYAVFFGRFSPFHDGHLKVLIGALEASDYLVLVLGSANVPRNTRNPFTVAERTEIIRASLPPEISARVIITSCRDFSYNDTRWLAAAQAAVNEAIEIHKETAIYSNNAFKDYNFNIALAGMHKDATSYYINSFPMWDNSISIYPETWEGEVLSATKIRNKMFRNELDYVKELNPLAKTLIYEIMERNKVEFERLFSDFKYEDKYESVYGRGPHMTTDACVVQAGNILLVERGGEYGKGLLALPGGFLNHNEKFIDGCIRELREETRLKVAEKILLGSLKKVVVFDDPHRSNRSRIVTHAHHFELNAVGALPKVQGGDDAAKAHWYPISSIQNMEYMFFEDHYAMISVLLSI